MVIYKRLEVEQEQEWYKEINRIPFIRFPSEWEIQVVPPFNDAVIRFMVRLPSDAVKSVYLDTRDSLGFYPDGPYWEVYPYYDDVGRCGIDDVEKLLEMIGEKKHKVQNNS